MNTNKILACLLTALFLAGASTLAYASEPKLVASSLSDRYHRSTCKVAQKIRKEDLIVYPTPEAAIEAGLDPCKKCYPPTSSGDRSDK